MIVCNKCGRRFPESTTRVICLCDIEPTEFIEMNFPAINSEPAKIENQEEEKIKSGRKAWLVLHSYQYETIEKTKEFYYNIWKEMIPSYGCSCRNEFQIIEDMNSPNFNSKEEFFEWGVLVHNLVNIKLNKPIMSLEEAKKVYNMV